LGVATGHDYLDRGFFEAVMEKSVTRIGPAAIAGKINLYTNTGGNLDLLDTFNLLGDPATNMPISVTHITVTPSPTRTRTTTPSATATRTPSRTPTITATPTATIRPTSATLVNFSAMANNKSVVRLRWQTGNEVAVLGFNVWRKTFKKGGKGQWRTLNRELILAKHPGTLQGDAYVFADKNPDANKKNSYKLEIVHADGTSEWSDVKTLNLK
jgi:hypothetical protein